MANLCSYEMKVVGKKENIKEFIKVMQSNYDYNLMKFDFDRHIGGRVFEVNCNEIQTRNDGLYETYIVGSCAWSVSSCMLDGGSYYNLIKKIHGEKCRSTTLEIESKSLDLDIEVFSTEAGMCFAEHYLIRKGFLEIAERAPYYEYLLSDFQTKESAEEELGIEISDEEWERGDDWICRGGFSEDIEYSPEYSI